MKKNKPNIPITVTELSEFAVNRVEAVKKLKVTKAKRLLRLNRDLSRKNSSNSIQGNAFAMRGIYEHKKFENEIGHLTKGNRLGKYVNNRLEEDQNEKNKLINDHLNSRRHSLLGVSIIVALIIMLAWN
mgnify:CR=1 FL=1